jgi:hypothetical protein
MIWHRIGINLSFIAGIVLATSATTSAEPSSHSDVAMFLAGMPLPVDSPLQDLVQDDVWRQHAGAFGSAFDNLEGQQLGKIRDWSAAQLKFSQPVMFYFFSGPDFAYADAFFPNAATYVLSGIEAVGQVPDLTTLGKEVIAQTLNNIEQSLNSLFLASYFITAKMDVDLNNGPVNGVLPLLYIFLARSGKVIHEVQFVDLDRNGSQQLNNGSRGNIAARGVKIVFATANREIKTLYYFSADVADRSMSQYALLQFCRRLGSGDSLLKSASYLLHKNNFSQVRDFLLKQSSVIVQDDSGIPVANFDRRKWQLFAFGRYHRPYGVFAKYYQPKLTELFQQQRATPLEFGIGYQARFGGSNVLLATKPGTAGPPP